MISVVVLVAIAAGVAIGVAGSALYVARGNAVGWLVMQQRQPEYLPTTGTYSAGRPIKSATGRSIRGWQSPPVRSIGAENLAGSGVSGLAQPPRSGAAGGLDSTGAAWTIQARPGTGYREITRSETREGQS